MTFEQARKKAKAVLGAAANGNDPSAVRAAKRREMLISELRDLYEKVGCVIQRGKRIGQPMKALTKQYTIARIDNHIVPLLGRKRVGDLRIADEIGRASCRVRVGQYVKNSVGAVQSKKKNKTRTN